MKVRERRRRLADEISNFVHWYSQQHGPKVHEPNDRPYSRKIEVLVKRMDVRELDLILRDEDD